MRGKDEDVKQKMNLSKQVIEETDHRAAVAPVLTPGRLPPGLSVLTGMELRPFREEEAGLLLLLVTTGDVLGKEGGEVEV